MQNKHTDRNDKVRDGVSESIQPVRMNVTETEEDKDSSFSSGQETADGFEAFSSAEKEISRSFEEDRPENTDDEAEFFSGEEAEGLYGDENSAELETAGNKKNDLLSEILEYLKLFLLVLLLSVFLTQFVIQRNTVKGPSMLPTLHDGDELFVEKVSRYFGAIDRFDIITIDTKGLDQEPNRVIKRVVGLPGETVEIVEGHVYINGKMLDEYYLAENITTRVYNPQYAKVTLGDGEYYCLGDNRNNSNDSRAFGPVPQKNILGNLLFRFYPFDSFGRPK